MYKIESAQDGGVAPKGPNFLLIVLLFGAAIVIVLAVAYFMVGRYSHDAHPSHEGPHPNSRLALPAPGSGAADC